MVFNKSTVRKKRIRAKLKRFSNRLRLSVFRSNKYIYSQIIDDKKGNTLVSASSADLRKDKKKSTPATSGDAGQVKKTKKLKEAYQVGEIIAKRASKKKIKQVYFDRGGCKYHGRIKALAKGAREGGLEF